MSKPAFTRLDHLYADFSYHINQVSDHFQVSELLAHSVGRVLINLFKRDQLTKDEYRDYISTDLVHIKDWLAASVLNNEPWLKNTDEQGRPKKLMKFSTIAQITQEADKAMIKAAQKKLTVSLSKRDEELIMKLSDDFYIVKMLTPEALDRESAYMQHCIGQGAYDEKVRSEEHGYYSLRDRAGKPHVTREIFSPHDRDDFVILQIQGKQNQPPISKYALKLEPFFHAYKHAFANLDILERLPFISDESGKIHSFEKLPDVISCGRFEMKKYKDEKGLPVRLPREINARNLVELENIVIEKFPSQIVFPTTANEETYGRSLLVFYDLDIREMPSQVKIEAENATAVFVNCQFPGGGSIETVYDLRIDQSSNLPYVIKAGQDLTIVGDSGESFDAKISVGRDFVVEDRTIMTLPDGITVMNKLDISYSGQLTSLPRNLDVGILDMRYTAINEFPDCIKVRCGIVLSDNTIDKFPDGIADNVWLKLINQRVSFSSYQGCKTVGEFRQKQLEAEHQNSMRM